MVTLKSLSGVMQFPLAYRLWQAPFVKSKFAPIMRQNDLSSINRVLDVGCGPGTNAPLFPHVDYLGLDINEKYIAMARRRYGREFATADVRTYEAPPDSRFDFILLNSLLHHIDTENVYRILRQLHGQLTPGGHIHILDLVMPDSRSIARWLARSDRGDFPRPIDEWAEIFRDVFEEVVFEPYPVARLGMTLWSMVYFKGKAKT